MKDVTVHNLEKHLEQPGATEESLAIYFNSDGTGKRQHTKAWYKFWPINKNEAKCPTCQVPARFANEKAE